jgi:hypothetical protein
MAIACKMEDGKIRTLESLQELIWAKAFADTISKKRDGRGNIPDLSSNANILRYVLKNSRYFLAAHFLQRSPTRLINIKQDPRVDEFFRQMLEKTPVIIDGVDRKMSQDCAAASGTSQHNI